MNGDNDITWRKVIIAAKEVGETHGESWERWLREAKATEYLDKPELFEQAYSGPAVKGWPLTDSKDPEARRLEIMNRLGMAGEPHEPAETFRFQEWPTDFKYVNQRFGAPGKAYTDAGFPGHEGIDLLAPLDTPYYAVAAGIVRKVRIREGNEGYGTYVMIDHPGDFSTLYAHARARPEPPVRAGDRISAGQKVAVSGNTGRSTAPHLHLTLKKKDHRQPGWEKKIDYMDPGPFVMELLRKLEPKVNACYIHESHLEIRSNNKAFVRPKNLVTNLRDKADPADRHVFSWVPDGTLVRLLTNTPENGYYKCELLAL